MRISKITAVLNPLDLGLRRETAFFPPLSVVENRPGYETFITLFFFHLMEGALHISQKPEHILYDGKSGWESKDGRNSNRRRGISFGVNFLLC